ncbi:MAG: hypothetical protein HQL44_12180 [Alphaproteobacteria bacterium]|nr:hypothetical protein [Alphaproteobacteria bacterium]
MMAGIWQAVLSLAGHLLHLLPLAAAWRAGQLSANAERLAQALDHAKAAQAIDEEVARLDDRALGRELLRRGE